jgi:hypothetical protein
MWDAPHQERLKVGMQQWAPTPTHLAPAAPAPRTVADCCHTQAAALAAQHVEQRDDEARAAGADGVPDGHCPPKHVHPAEQGRCVSLSTGRPQHSSPPSQAPAAALCRRGQACQPSPAHPPLWVQPQQLPVGQVHHREGLVHLPVLHLPRTQPCSRRGEGQARRQRTRGLAGGTAWQALLWAGQRDGLPHKAQQAAGSARAAQQASRPGAWAAGHPPACASALGTASVGATGKSRGSVAASPKPSTRPSTGRRYCRTAAAEASTTAAAPSLMGDALPAANGPQQRGGTMRHASNGEMSEQACRQGQWRAGPDGQGACL